MTLQHLHPEGTVPTVALAPPLTSPAVAVRQLPCTLCWALADQPCRDFPPGDHLRRWTDAGEAGLITRADLATAITELAVITAWTVVSGSPASAIADMATSRERPFSAPDPGLFAALTDLERDVLRAHLTSGWYKQSVVYPGLSVAWWDTKAVLDDIHLAWESAHKPDGARLQADGEDQ